MQLAELVRGITPKKISGEPHTEISGLTYDSRLVKPGDLFAAILGTRQDGHRYLEEAVKKGAAALLVETPLKNSSIPQIVVSNSREALAHMAAAFYHHPDEQLTLIGVTGTNGKTTTTYLVEAIFQKTGIKTGIIGTIQYKIGEKIIPTKNTTPESADLFQMFREMAETGVGAAAIEVSSHALDQGRIEGIHFNAAVFTNLTQDHLDYHQTIEAYFQAKAKLFEAHFLKKNAVAVINLDDPFGQRLQNQIKTPTITYGLDKKADVRASQIQLQWKETSFQVETPKGGCFIKLPLAGEFNVYNAMAAIGVGLSQNLPLETIQAGLESAKPVRGRFELASENQPFAVIVDYAHTPDGLENLLQSAKKLTPKKLIVVFGCGGDRDRGKRPKMGAIAENFADEIIVTSDNPRSEDPMAIIREIEKGMNKPHHVEPDRQKAIGLALSLAKPHDSVIIAGKGHETMQIFKDKSIHFDDREIVKVFLEKRAAPQSA